MRSPGVTRPALALCLLMACGPSRETGPREDIPEDRAPIVGSAARADSTHRAVVAIVSDQGGQCSGTVVQKER